MYARILLALACLIPLATPASNAPRPTRHELPNGDCLRTDRINDWNVIDMRTVTVRNGPHHFLVRTTVDCPRMDLGGSIHFRSSESDKAMGGMRICGGLNEQIARRSDPPCRIQSVQVIDKAQYDALSRKARRHGVIGGPGGGRP
jgi:hypothetical protein